MSIYAQLWGEKKMRGTMTGDTERLVAEMKKAITDFQVAGDVDEETMEPTEPETVMGERLRKFQEVAGWRMNHIFTIIRKNSAGGGDQIRIELMRLVVEMAPLCDEVWGG